MKIFKILNCSINPKFFQKLKIDSGIEKSSKIGKIFPKSEIIPKIENCIKNYKWVQKLKFFSKIEKYSKNQKNLSKN